MMKTNGITLTSKPGVNPPRTETPAQSDRCAVCGAETARPQLSVREFFVNVICGPALLAILAGVFYGTDRWIEIHIHYSPEHLLWHEPLEDWNQL